MNTYQRRYHQMILHQYYSNLRNHDCYIHPASFSCCHQQSYTEHNHQDKFLYLHWNQSLTI